MGLNKEVTERWNSVILSITGVESQWIMNYEIHEVEVAKKIIELGDYVQNTLNGVPNDWVVNELSKLLYTMRRELDKLQ